MLSPTTPLSPASRAQALERLAGDELDVLVIGAGVTGAGAALDAATRGLTVGLVEARDFASGTSSRSSKLFHGGLRYLEQLDFRLVFEALQERKLALETPGPAPGPAGPVHLPAAADRGRPRVRRSGHRGLRRDGRRSRGAEPPAAPRPAQDDRAVRLRRPVGDPRLDRVLRRPGRRRPAHHDAVPDRRRTSGPRWPAAPGWSASWPTRPVRRAGSAAGSPGSGCATWSRAGRSRSAPGTVINATGVWTDELAQMLLRPVCSRPGRSGSAPPRASTWSSPGTGSTPAAD